MSSATMALKTASARRRPASRSSASSHSVNTISSHFPIISKPATTLGKQIKVPGSHWEGRLAEKKNTMRDVLVHHLRLHCPAHLPRRVQSLLHSSWRRSRACPSTCPSACPGARLRAYPTTPLTALFLALLFARWTRPRSLHLPRTSPAALDPGS